MISFIVLTVALVDNIMASRYIRVANINSYPIWIETWTKSGDPLKKIVCVGSEANYRFVIPESGWEGRIWPKFGCNYEGNNCTFGQSQPPCPPGGCQPTADTKV